MTKTQQDPALEALNTLVEVASSGVSDLAEIEHDLLEIQKHRSRGWTWQRIVSSSDVPNMLSTVSNIAAKIGRANAGFRRALVHGLRQEGIKITSIAATLNVSRQRVSALAHQNSSISAAELSDDQ